MKDIDNKVKRKGGIRLFMYNISLNNRVFIYVYIFIYEGLLGRAGKWKIIVYSPLNDFISTLSLASPPLLFCFCCN